MSTGLIYLLLKPNSCPVAASCKLICVLWCMHEWRAMELRRDRSIPGQCAKCAIATVWCVAPLFIRANCYTLNNAYLLTLKTRANMIIWIRSFYCDNKLTMVNCHSLKTYNRTATSPHIRKSKYRNECVTMEFFILSFRLLSLQVTHIYFNKNAYPLQRYFISNHHYVHMYVRILHSSATSRELCIGILYHRM